MTLGPVGATIQKFEAEFGFRAFPSWIYTKATQSTEAGFTTWFPAAVRNILSQAKEEK